MFPKFDLGPLLGFAIFGVVVAAFLLVIGVSAALWWAFHHILVI